MARKARIVLPGFPHHVTQRGNNKEDVFFNPDDYFFYLDDLYKYSRLYDVEVLSYCLLTNHVHHLLVPAEEKGLERLFKPLHVRYAQRMNKRLGRSGHFWQGRFYSSPIEGDYLLAALRYIEQNPVKAKMVEHPSDYLWSSAYYRCRGENNPILTVNPEWIEFFSETFDWHRWLGMENDKVKEKLIREHTLRDLPSGSCKFLDNIGEKLNRRLVVRKVGRPKKKEK